MNQLQDQVEVILAFNMKNFFFDSLAVQKMASGHVCLNLSEQVSWETFPSFSENLLKMIGGQIEQKLDSFDIRIWKINICGCVLRLVFDDFPVMASLESSDHQGDELLEKIYCDLSKKTHAIA